MVVAKGLSEKTRMKQLIKIPEVNTFPLKFYFFNGKCQFHGTAKLYRNICFRPDIELIMEEKTFIGDNCIVLVPKLTMRKGSQINAGTIITGRHSIELGHNVVVAYSCVLITSSDTPEGEFMNDASSEDKRKIRGGAIWIGANSFVGSQTLIMPNVTIGEGIVVYAKSYVDKDLTLNYFTYRDNKRFVPRKTWKNPMIHESWRGYE